MEERRATHGLVQMHRINKNLAPSYLTDRITHHENIHNYNTRHRQNIVVDNIRSSSRAHSFFPTFSKLYNDINRTVDYRNTSIDTFRNHAKRFIINKRI